MAGAGYKLFNTGDVLTAAQVNTYLMEQTVMVFANAAARTTALSGVVSEGMISYLKDTNAVEVYDGSNWVSSDDPNAIQNSIINAKGDLIVGSANDTPSILSVSSDGSTLVADSSATTGLRYTSGLGLTQPIINGSFDIWQRGTSTTLTTSAYVADRWQGYRNAAGATVSRQGTADTTNLPFVQYCARVQRNSGNTAVQELYISQSVETANAIPFAGKTVTLSFYARAGANYSSASSGLKVEWQSGTGTDQNWLSYTGAAAINNTTVTLTTTWQRFSVSGTMGATAKEFYTAFYYTPVGTAGANDYFEITGVQVDVGNVALPLRRSGGTLAGELAACQRYYEKSYSTDVAPGTNTGLGMAYNIGGSDGGNSAGVLIMFKVPKRVDPTMTYYEETGTVGNWRYLRSGFGSTAASAVTAYAGTYSAYGYLNCGAAYVVTATAGHWTASAEL